MQRPKHPWGLIANPNDPDGRVGVVGLTDHLPPYLVTQADDLEVLTGLKKLLDETWSGTSEAVAASKVKLLAEFKALGADTLIDTEATIDAAIARFNEQRQQRWRQVIEGIAQCPLPLKRRTRPQQKEA